MVVAIGSRIWILIPNREQTIVELRPIAQQVDPVRSAWKRDMRVGIGFFDGEVTNFDELGKLLV